MYVVHLMVWIINCTKYTVCISKYSPLCFSPRAHGGDNDVGNLIVSECLPETSRPALYFTDDYNINSVNKSNEAGSFLSHASGVHSVEMKSVWCNIIEYKLLWNDNWFVSIVTIWRFCPLQWLFSNKQRMIILGSIELINSINLHLQSNMNYTTASSSTTTLFDVQKDGDSILCQDPTLQGDPTSAQVHIRR